MHILIEIKKNYQCKPISNMLIIEFVTRCMINLVEFNKKKNFMTEVI